MYSTNKRIATHLFLFNLISQAHEKIINIPRFFLQYNIIKIHSKQYLISKIKILLVKILYLKSQLNKKLLLKKCKKMKILLLIRENYE